VTLIVVLLFFNTGQEIWWEEHLRNNLLVRLSWLHVCDTCVCLFANNSGIFLLDVLFSNYQ